MKQSYYAHGKLLLTGEYVVLDGALAIALPTAKGQKMDISEDVEGNFLHWKSYNHLGEIWLEGIWDVHQQQWQTISDNHKAQYIQALFQYADAELGIDLSGYAVTTRLEFPNDWGLGSSSTLISLLAQWWRTDPYYLLQKTFGGSGYDIACATSDTPVLYQRAIPFPKTEPLQFAPVFKDWLAFLYLGQKQDSREGIRYYKSLQDDKSEWIEEINDISRKILKCEDFDEFEYLLSVHEVIISRMLQIEKVKDRLFPDYWGAVKSLGAWGGDFVLITHHGDFEDAGIYFEELGYDTLIPYNEMILQ